MNETCIINIMAHGGVQPCFDLNIKLWERFGHPIQVWCPENDPVKTTHPILKLGHTTGKHGDGHVLRAKKLLSYFCKSGYDYSVIAEYDSISLGENISLEPGLRGIMFNDIETFIAPKYVMSPWTLDKQSAIEIVSKWNKYPNIKERGILDRLFPALAYVAGVPIIEYYPRGFSRNTIMIEDIPELIEAINRGASDFHGVKRPEMLAFIVELYKDHNK